MTDAVPNHRALARKLQQRIASLGAAVVVIDDDRRAHVIAGWELEILGHYTAGVSLDDLQADLAHAAVRSA